jgi:predicted nucleic acid-binding protein
MLIADTSAWIEWLRHTESRTNVAFRDAFAEDRVILLEPVKAELLIGARDRAEVGVLRRLLETVEFELVHPR